VGNGGKDLLKLDDAMAAVDDFVSEKLKPPISLKRFILVCEK
jgi:hypothetical protein